MRFRSRERGGSLHIIHVAQQQSHNVLTMHQPHDQSILVDNGNHAVTGRTKQVQYRIQTGLWQDTLNMSRQDFANCGRS
jgi:hypothetical protein